ncbi:MAG: hypothetical protein HY458_00560 [Parcubacteria group bacterium]|nr:hypothetical protein [Parcubacteria group bacterium]
MITKETIEQLYRSRVEELGRVQKFLGKEFVDAIEKKLQEERDQLLRIAESEELALAARQKYSLPLDPVYFQQKFYSSKL